MMIYESCGCVIDDRLWNVNVKCLKRQDKADGGDGMRISVLSLDFDRNSKSRFS